MTKAPSGIWVQLHCAVVWWHRRTILHFSNSFFKTFEFFIIIENPDYLRFKVTFFLICAAWNTFQKSLNVGSNGQKRLRQSVPIFAPVKKNFQFIQMLSYLPSKLSLYHLPTLDFLHSVLGGQKVLKHTDSDMKLCPESSLCKGSQVKTPQTFRLKTYKKNSTNVKLSIQKLHKNKWQKECTHNSWADFKFVLFSCLFVCCVCLLVRSLSKNIYIKVKKNMSTILFWNKSYFIVSFDYHLTILL